jgi:phosphoribosyl-ATP pyrophosphohydrolase
MKFKPVKKQLWHQSMQIALDVFNKDLEAAFEEHKKYWRNYSTMRITDQFGEESGELFKALIKSRWKRSKGGSREDILEEMADTLLCLQFITVDMNINYDEFCNMFRKKLNKMRAAFKDKDAPTPI